MCGRAVIDNFVTPKQVTQLRNIAEIGMQNRSKLGGPTIMDINTGFVRDIRPVPRVTEDGGMLCWIKSLLTVDLIVWTAVRVVEKIRMAVMKEFDLEKLYFSAPTFITRLIGNESWTPSEIHDEYW
ncbi:unnamed protein product [Phytophthora lilii]|uniref:Unnamed protein product n=1 Tax=Phytophthora lilii TaxID=2077276 RepID=A0A9W6WVV8_9STRA|nr:unnamed protein product [Phytophthora lilii]